MNSSTWVLIADSSRGRLFSVAERSKPWTLLKEFDHAAGRVSVGGLSTDQPGRTHGSGTRSARSAMQSKTAPKEVEAEHFAHELATMLQDGHGHQAYARIVLVAPPHFLGLLRKSIKHTISKLIGATLDKDYLHVSDAEMHQHLDLLI